MALVWPFINPYQNGSIKLQPDLSDGEVFILQLVDRQAFKERHRFKAVLAQLCRIVGGSLRSSPDSADPQWRSSSTLAGFVVEEE